jgi:hypothetical protein
MAVLCAPLFADAWQGLAMTLDDGASKQSAMAVSSFLSRQLSLSAQFTSSRVLLCWLWFFLGILWHSRTSAAMALVGVSMCLIGSKWLPGFADASLAMNLVAMFVALGGHYLRLNARSMVWMLLLACAMAWAHPRLSDQLLATGLLPLCLPFNTALLLSLAVMRRDRVPIEWAACSPAEIRVFFAQKEVAEACWAKLRKSDAEKSSMHRPAACSLWQASHDLRPTTRNA